MSGASGTNSESSAMTLRDHIFHTMCNYYTKSDGSMKLENVYELVMTEVEEPLLEVTMQYTDFNLTQAARILGVSRETLRKRLQHYGILPRYQKN